jgi:hypothetical protein
MAVGKLCSLHNWRFHGDMLHSVKNFTEDQTFKVIIGDMKSEKITIDNGVVQGLVQSFKTNEPRNETPGPRRNQTINSANAWTVGILGYADDRILYTRNHQMLQAQINIQAALDRVAEWSESNAFRISQKKNQGHANMPYTIETRKPSSTYNTLEWTNIGGSQHKQNSGAYTEQTTNMEITHRNGESKMQQETEPFETYGQWRTW